MAVSTRIPVNTHYIYMKSGEKQKKVVAFP